MGSLCTGIGGLELGVTAVYGGDTRLAWYSELNPDASTVLEHRLPGVPNLGDLTTVDWSTVARVDLLTAGFPCQPVSSAGAQKGDDDERWLWPHVRACYQALKPQEIVLENVRNLISIRAGALFAQICADLRADGYAVRWGLAGACAVGAPHHRHRVFIIARYAWQLDPPPAQRVDMIECGARRGKGRVLLPTPTASAYGRNRGGQNPDGPIRWSLNSAHLLLPTPTTSDGMGGPGSAGRDGGDNLRTVAAHLGDTTGGTALLPTRRAGDTGTPGRRASEGFRPPLSQVIGGIDTQALLPTPTVRDYKAGYDNPRGRAGTMAPPLNDVAQQHLSPAAGVLLFTPRHSDAAKGGPNQRGSAGDLMLPCAVIGARYGRYAPAVAVWEHLTGVSAPEPTVLNRSGQWRLNPALPEWMMGYPPGWITALVGRAAALRAAGNGVVPQVFAAVYPLITAGWPYLSAAEPAGR